MTQNDFVALQKYITFSCGLKTLCQDLLSKQDATHLVEADLMQPYVPVFIRRGEESVSSLHERLTTKGLTKGEIDDILCSIALECKVHVRRSGKARLRCQVKLDRTPSEEDALSQVKRSLLKRHKKEDEESARDLTAAPLGS